MHAGALLTLKQTSKGRISHRLTHLQAFALRFSLSELHSLGSEEELRQEARGQLLPFQQVCHLAALRIVNDAY